MQEMIESGLLMAVAALSVILLLIGQRPSSGMTKKQKIMLGRILTATVLLLALQTLGAGFFDRLGAAGRWVRLGFYLADYLIIGYCATQPPTKMANAPTGAPPAIARTVPTSGSAEPTKRGRRC